MKKLFVSFYLLLSLSSQGQIREVDSLNRVLAGAKEDTVRVMTLARLSFYDQSFEHGLKLAQEGLELAKKIGYKKGEGQCLHQIGNQFAAASIFNLALHYYIESLKIREEIGDWKGAARSYGGIGLIYQTQGNYQSALNYYFQSLNIHEQLQDNYFLAIINGNIGGAYLKQNRIDSAMYYSQRSFEFFNLSPDKYQFASTLNVLGNVHAGLQNIDLALSYYRLAISNGIIYSDSTALPASYLGVAQLFDKTGQIDSSIAYAKQAIAFGQTGKQQPVVIDAGKLLSELYRNRDDKEALKYLNIAMTARDSTFGAEKVLQIQSLTYSEQEREKEAEEARLKEEQRRKQNLQYALIALGVISFIILFLLLSRSIITSARLIRFLGVIALLIVFEFLNLFLHPFLEKITHHSPVLMLLALVCIAALLVPLHHRLEKWAIHKLVEKNKQIRLASAKKTIQKLEGD